MGHQVTSWSTNIHYSWLSDVEIELRKLKAAFKSGFSTVMSMTWVVFFHPYCFQIYINLFPPRHFFPCIWNTILFSILAFFWNPNFSLPPHLLWNQILINVTHKPNRLNGANDQFLFLDYLGVSIVFSNLSPLTVLFSGMKRLKENYTRSKFSTTSEA